MPAITLKGRKKGRFIKLTAIGMTDWGHFAIYLLWGHQYLLFTGVRGKEERTEKRRGSPHPDSHIRISPLSLVRVSPNGSSSLKRRKRRGSPHPDLNREPSGNGRLIVGHSVPAPRAWSDDATTAGRSTVELWRVLWESPMRQRTRKEIIKVAPSVPKLWGN